MEARGLQSARGASAKSSDARCLSRGDRASSSKIDVFEMEQMAGELDGRLEKTESRSDLMEAMQVRQAMLERQDSQGKIKEEGSLPDHVLSAASQCSEFFKAPAVDLLESLRAKYDPTGQGAKLQPQLHSDQALLQRESLKFDPLILKTLEELWQVIDTNKNGVLDQDEYHEFHSKLALVLVPTASIRQSQIFFEQDWIRDTDGGRLRVTKKVFGESMFELADRWTDSISAVDYIRFLHGTFQALSELDPTGRRVYRSDASIREHMRTLAPLSSLHAKTLSAARDKAAAFERARARALREGRELTWEDFEALYVAHKDKYANPKQNGPAGAQLYAKRALARSSTGLAEERIRKALESAAKRGSARTDSRQSLRRSASGSGSFKGTRTRTRQGSQVAAGGGSDEDEDEKRRRASRALEGNRFYPPPASWWARHARRKHNADAAARASALTGNMRLAFSPEGQDFVGILLFDARDPRRLHHLIISTQRMSVEDSAVLEIRHALRRAELDGQERLLVSSPCEDRLCAEARSAGFSHAVSQADWVNFCTRVDELTTGSTKLWMDHFEFAGFASAYNKQAGGVCCNFLFDAEEMSAKLNYVTARPQLGLGCPYLQAQVAKFVAHKLRVEFGNGAPAPTANTSGCPSMLRSTSSRLLLETLDKGYVPDGDDQRLQSQKRQRSAQGGLGEPSIVAASQSEVDTLSSSSPGARTLQRTESSLDGFSATSEVQQEAARFGLHKRHTLGALNEKERKVRQEVLSQRQRHRIAAVEHRYRRKNEVPSLQTFLESQYGVRYPGIVRSSSKLPPRNSLPALPPRNVRSSAKPSS